MPALTIRMKKHTDGTATLTCERADGTTTWQRQRGPQGAFVPLHDLTHLAVETGRRSPPARPSPSVGARFPP